MTWVPALNQVSGAWLSWVGGSLVDGCIALGVAALLWSLFGRRMPPRFGAWLFALVMLKCLVSLPTPVPFIERALPAIKRFAGADEKAVAPAPPEMPAQLDIAAIGAPHRPTLELTSWLALTWLVGVLAGMVRMFWIWRRTRALISASQLVSAASIDHLPTLIQRSALRRPLTVRLSDHLHSPAVTGWLHPVLLLPAGLQDRLSPAQLRWVLAHELAHLRGGDVAWQFMESLIRTALFFHPAVWIASAQSARLRERACDEAALQISGTSRQASAEGFVSLIEWCQQRPAAALAGLGIGTAGREARSRIRALAQGPLRQAARPWRVAFALIAAAAVLPSFRAGHAQQAPASERARIIELEQRVANLERQLQAKSRLETLRETAIRRSHQRVAADNQRFTSEQLREIESLYQDAKQRSATGEDLALAFQPLLDRYPAANRTGCAILLLARLKQGTEREHLLQRAIQHHSDAYFLDGTTVGGVARLMLGQDAEAAGRPADAARWREEIRKNYAGDLDFGAVPLVDILTTPPINR